MNCTCGKQLICPVCDQKQCFGATGRVKSPKKAASSRANGKKGGRPEIKKKIGTIRLWAGYYYTDTLKYPTRREAIAALRASGRYTHYRTPGGRLLRL